MGSLGDGFAGPADSGGGERGQRGSSQAYCFVSLLENQPQSSAFQRPQPGDRQVKRVRVHMESGGGQATKAGRFSNGSRA